MYMFILILHIIIVVALLVVILIQRGRSGGLIEALGGVESLFGTKTNIFFVKITVVLAVLFFTSTITLAWLAKGRSKSLMATYKNPIEENTRTQKTTPSKEEASTTTTQPVLEQTPQQADAAVSAENTAAGSSANENK